MGQNISLIIVFFFCIVGPSAVFGAGIWASINALGRNPSSAPKIFTAMIIGLVFAWTLSVVAMLIVFQLFAP